MNKKEEKNIKITDKGYYRVRFILYGYKVDKTFKFKKDAIDFKNAKTREIERMKREGISFEKHDLTFEEAFLEMLENQKDKKGNYIEKTNYYQFKNQTIDNYKKTFKNHLQGLENKLLKDLTVADINKTLNVIPKMINGRKSNVQYRTRIVISKVIEYAEDNNYIFRFPKSYGKNVEKYRSNKEIIHRNNFIEEKDLLKIINNVPNLSDNHRKKISNEDIIFIFKLFFYSGLRCGEARGLMVKDFSVKDKRYTITVQRQMLDGTQIISESLKLMHESRIVFLKENVYKSFIDYFKNKGYKENDFVFDFLHDGIVISRQKISRMIKKTIKDLKGLDILDKKIYSDLSPQDLRVSNTRYLKEIGTSDELRAAIQGHNVTTQNAYYESITDDIDSIFGIN